MTDHIDKFLDLIEPAFNRNYDEIWHGEYYSIGQMRDIYKSRMEDNTRWMDNFINATLDAAIGDIEADSFGETITVIPSANGTFTVKGASAPLVAVTVTGLDGRAGAATVTGADTFVFDAVPGLYILSATTSAGRTLPVKFTVR